MCTFLGALNGYSEEEFACSYPDIEELCVEVLCFTMSCSRLQSTFVMTLAQTEVDHSFLSF